MACEEFALNWNDHHETLVAVFEKLLERSTLVDCTIAAEGQYLKAHKVILSACSPYFELLFSQEKDKNPIIILKDIKFRELKAMIEFVYRGSVKIPEDHLQDFVDAAESLQIKGLGLDQRNTNSGKGSNEFGNIGRKKNELLPPPNKRFKNSSLTKIEENSPNLPSEVLTVSKNVTSRSDSLHKIERNVAKSSSLFTDSVSDSSAFENIGQESHKENFLCSTEQSVFAAISQSSHYVPETSEFGNIGLESHEDNFPCSTEQSSVFAEMGAVVKTEPEDEPVRESIVPDNLVEPKKEEFEQEEITILDSDDGAEESLDADGFHDENSQQLSSFSPTHETVPGDLDEREHCNTQGLQRSHADEGQLASSSCLSDMDGNAAASVQSSPWEGVYFEDNHPKTSTDALSSFETRSAPDAKHVRRRSIYTCQVCGLVEISRSHLARHMRSHTGERPFRCPQCGENFTRKYHLVRHQTIHVGLKTYKCSVCEKHFSRLDHLQSHRKIHIGDRPFSCVVCGKSFARQNYLQLHQKIHSDVRPYRCGVCQKTFTFSSNFLKHQKIHV